MPSYTNAWDETAPAGTDNLSSGDDEIRQLKLDMRERLNTDHYWPSTDVTETGYHRAIHLPVESGDPTNVASTGIVYTKDVSAKAELFWEDEDANVLQLTAAGKLLLKEANIDDDTDNVLLKAGMIIMWSGTLANIPSGWQLCDGTNSSPDLREKMMPCVAAATDPGAVSGDGYVHAHTHAKGTIAASQGSHGHSWRFWANTGVPKTGNYFFYTSSDVHTTYERTATASVVSASAGAITISGSTESTGSLTLYALAYIFKT